MAPKTGLVPIGAAAKMAGVSRQQLQYYLMVGLLEPAKVTGTARRLFDPENIARIKLVKRLNDDGYPLREIRDIFLKDKAGLAGAKSGPSRSGGRDSKRSRR